MGTIMCEECRAEFEPEELAIKNRVIVDGETYEKVTETYFLCPVCGAHYTVTVLDQQQGHSKSENQSERTPTKNRNESWRRN